MSTVTYKDLKSAAHVEQNIRFTEALLDTSFHSYGKNRFSTYCPFHKDTEDSFRVYIDKKGEVRFHCFGQCKGDWDIYDVIMRKKKCSFREAQQEFAGYVGETQFQSHKNRTDDNIVDSGSVNDETAHNDTDCELDPIFMETLQNSSVFYNRLLLEDCSRFEKIRSYLERRGVDSGLINKFNIGYAPAYQDDEHEGRALIKNNIDLFHEDYLEFNKYYKGGLLRLLNDETTPAFQYYRRYIDHSQYLGIYGEYGDFFAGRITFPVFDVKGNIQGIIGRRPDNRGKARWIKQQAYDTCIRPAGWLYGIDKAVPSITLHKTVILVEGIFDYFAFYNLFQNRDIPCVVSTLGTKITEEARNTLLSLGIENFIVAYDWDDAGRYAIKKAAQKINGTVYYLGGMAENEDPAVRLKGVVNSINSFSLGHLISASQNIQKKTEKPIFISHITTGKISEREIIFKPEKILESDRVFGNKDKAGEYHYNADNFLPLLTYDHGNKAGLKAKISLIGDLISTRPTEATGERSFRLPGNFVREEDYIDLGAGLIFWLRIAIEQQTRKRKIRETDGTLAGWLKTSRATIIKYKKMLLDQGYMKVDTSRKLQRLSVRYFSQ